MEMIDIVSRLLLATALGGLIGLERELHGQAAGLRTHIIVCLGSTLIMMVSIEVGRMYGNADPSRIAAQVVTGMGFLGAGAIMRFGTTVKGLTTAACLWTVAGIGLAVGLGLWLPAVLVTVLVFVSIFVLDKLEKMIFIGRTYKRVVVTTRDVSGIIGRIERVIEDHGITIKDVGINKLLNEKKVQLTALAKMPETLDFDKFSKDVSKVDGVEHFEVD